MSYAQKAAKNPGELAKKAAEADQKKAETAKNLANKLKFFQKHVGFRVELQVGSPLKIVQGIIYAAHDTMVVLQEPAGLRLVNFCKENVPKRPKILEEKDGSNGKCKILDLNTVSSVHETAQQALVEKFLEAKAKREQFLENRNPKASALAQRIFNGLQKTFKCSWDDITICIEDLGNLRIAKPYTSDAVTGDSERALERVRNILEQMHTSSGSSSS